jgi:hypothetical protein
MLGFVMLIALPNGHAADVVADALAAKILELPEQLRRSLTWDQGKEMADHARFTINTGVQVYFCDPRSPWQRGSNENTNGLLRQYFPQTHRDRAHYTQADLDPVAAQLNGRPRQTLGWKTPSQALDAALRRTKACCRGASHRRAIGPRAAGCLTGVRAEAPERASTGDIAARSRRTCASRAVPRAK